MGRAVDPKKIKSAQRVLEVLEYFTSDRQEATVMDIARSMGYPQSSTSELLGCLVSLGYLHRDRYARTYKPSARVAVLGAWVQPALFRDGRLLPMMDELAADSGLSVVLATQVAVEVQYIHTVPATRGQPTAWEPGQVGRLLHTAAGKALLSTSSPDLVRKLAHRLNAESEPDLRVPFETLIEDLREVRAQGYAAGFNEAGGGMIAVLLPQATPDEQLVLGLGGPASALAEGKDEYVRLLRAVVARHLGPVAVSPPALTAPTNATGQQALRRFG